MSKNKFIDQYKNNETVNDVFWLSRCDLRTTAKGKPYLTLTLQDKTGSIDGKVWDNADAINANLTPQSFIHVRGKVNEFKEILQVKVDACKPITEDKVDLEDFTAHTEKDIDLLWEELIETMGKIKDPSLAKLFKTFLADKELVTNFKKATAAIKLHHAYVGGLLEHTVNILKLGKLISAEYQILNKDLLFFGIFLHDIGKIREYEVKVAPEHTDEGRLVGHTSFGILMLEEKARQVKDFPAELLMELQHLILSHHGEYAYGAPVLPMTPEAMVLHHLDNLDAKIGQYKTLQDAITDPKEKWTTWSNALGRRLYRRKSK